MSGLVFCLVVAVLALAECFYASHTLSADAAPSSRREALIEELRRAVAEAEA